MTTTPITCRACGVTLGRSLDSTGNITVPGLGEFHSYCAPNKWAREKILLLERANAQLTEAVLQARDEGDEIIAWLRDRASNPDTIEDRAFSIVAKEIADAIERGEHNQKRAPR